MDQPIAPRLERPLLVGALVLSGVAPILPLTAAALMRNDIRDLAAHALVAYAAVLVGFLGGLRWGAELRRSPAAPTPARLAAAASATVIGWAALLSPTRVALLLLLGTAAVQLAWDLVAARSGHLPAWMGPLRMAVAAVAALCLGAVAAALTDA